MSELGADRPGQREAHRAKAVRDQAGVRLVALIVARDPHLVGADVGEQDIARSQHLAHVPQDLLWLHRKAGIAPFRREIIEDPPAQPAPFLDVVQRQLIGCTEPRVQLFVDRAQSASPSFSLSEVNAAAVLDICRGLDGLPLAIELAAARVNSLEVQEIARRLKKQLWLVTGRTSTADSRHRTLRAAIEWSYELLSHAEKVLFFRLSAFVGSFGVDAVEEICVFDGIARSDVIGLLARLIETSMVERLPPGGPPGYRLLQTLKRYGAERLEESSDAEIIRRRHAEFFTRMAEHDPAEPRGPSSVPNLEELEERLPDIRVALEWLTENGRIRDAQTLTVDLSWVWFLHGHQLEGLRWVNALLNYPGSSPETSTRLLCNAALLTLNRGELPEAQLLADARDR